MLVMAIIVLTIAEYYYYAFDESIDEGAWMLLSGIAWLAVNFITYRTCLSASNAPVRFVVFFFAALGIGAVALLAAILFIIPGFYVAAMWIAALPILASSTLTIQQALTASAAMTEGNRWFIVFVCIILSVPSGVTSAWEIIVYPELATPHWLLIMNSFAFSWWQMSTALLGIVLYRRLGPAATEAAPDTPNAAAGPPSRSAP